MAEINNTGREIDWNDEIEYSDSYLILPQGDYPFTVTGFERSRHGGSAKIPPCNMAVISLEVFDEASEQTVNVQEKLYLHTTFAWKLSQFFVSIGLLEPGEKKAMDWTRVIGARGWCRLYVNKWTGQRDGREMENNRVDKFLAPDEAPAAQSTPAQAAAPAWKAGTF